MTIQQKVASPTPATDDNDLDAETLAGIRGLMAEAQPKARKTAAADDAPAPQTPPADPPAAAPAPRKEAHQSFAPLADDPVTPAQTRTKTPKVKQRRSIGSPFASLKSTITGYRPRPKHIFLATLALFVYFRPWLVLGLLFLSSMLMVGIFLALGYDGFWRRIMAVARWYANKRPARAAILHQRLDRFAVKWDRFLDRFPEGSVDGLYLPDFGEIAEADARHDAVLDRRLSGLRES